MRFIQDLRSRTLTARVWSSRRFVVGAALLGGCAAQGDLVVASDFELVTPSDDPVPGRPADQPPCAARSLVIEAEALELDTTVCDWITVRAPAQLPVRKGQDLELFFFHAALAAPEAAEAVIELRLGEDVAFRRVLGVPSAAGFYDEVLQAPAALSPGDPVWLHVHNHGANTYTLGHLRLP